MEKVFPLGAPRRLAVACSGGSDSLALLLLCQAWQRQNKQGQVKKRAFRKPDDTFLTALICDHGQRGESARECNVLQTRLKDDFGFAAHIFTPAVPLSSFRGNLQQNMRLFRLRRLLDWCLENKVSCLALGHTRDDQLETCMLQEAGLLRGRGGIRELRRVQTHAGAREPWQEGQAQEGQAQEGQAQEGHAEVFLLRPLLEASRASLRAWLRERGVGWLEDPSNASHRYARNRMRLICADLSQAEQSRLLARCATQQQEEQALEAAVQRFSRVHAEWHAEGYACIESKAFLALDEKVAVRLLAKVARSVGGKGVRTRQVLRVAKTWRVCLKTFLQNIDKADIGKIEGNIEASNTDGEKAATDKASDKEISAVLSLGRCLLFAKKRVFFATRAALNIESLPLTLALSQGRLWDGRLRILAPFFDKAFFVRWTCAPLTREGVVQVRHISRNRPLQSMRVAEGEGDAQLEQSLARFESLPWRVREVMPSFWHEGILRALPTLGITLEGEGCKHRLSTRRAEELACVQYASAEEQNLLFPIARKKVGIFAPPQITCRSFP